MFAFCSEDKDGKEYCYDEYDTLKQYLDPNKTESYSVSLYFNYEEFD